MAWGPPNVSKLPAPVVGQNHGVPKAAFGGSNTVLLFHLINHYALLYAWREWCEPNAEPHKGRMRKQLLTARKGRPPFKVQ
eukprot:2668746-Amphidinium_carterae.1